MREVGSEWPEFHFRAIGVIRSPFQEPAQMPIQPTMQAARVTMPNGQPVLRVAIPLSGEVFCEHFGRCDGFYLCDVVHGAIDRPRIVRRPKSKCESVPHWLRDMGVNLVLVGGIGVVGTGRLSELGIQVAVGYVGSDPQAIAERYLRQGPASQENPCARFEHRHRHCKTPSPSRKGERGSP